MVELPQEAITSYLDLNSLGIKELRSLIDKLQHRLQWLEDYWANNDYWFVSNHWLFHVDKNNQDNLVPCVR